MNSTTQQPEFEHRPSDPPDVFTRTRKLTPAEAARDRKIREQVMEEFPPAPGSRAALALEIRKLLAKLQQERKRQGLSLAQLAARTGLDKAALSRLENGHVPVPSLVTISCVAAALGKHLAYRLEDAADSARPAAPRTRAGKAGHKATNGR